MNTAPTDERIFAEAHARTVAAIRATNPDECQLRNGAHDFGLLASDYYDAGNLTDAARCLGMAAAYTEALRNI
jgi:hypothetical protein